LDLSIPRNVDENVQDLDNIALLHLDDLSQITDDAIEMRQKEVPKAQMIIEEIKQEFYEWCQTRRFVPTLRAFQDKLHQIKAEELNLLSKKGDVLDSTGAELISDQLIQKITNHLAHHLRNSNVQIEDQLQLIQSVFQLNMNSND
jgi:glutamyl-tRNA reductase